MSFARFPLPGRAWPMVFGAVLLAVVLPAAAQDEKPTPVAAPSYNDPAYERYVDLELLAEAWEDKNAELLTDLGLQLAEGERILLRPHKAITADHVLAMAVKIAGERRDKATLTRLAKVMEVRKKTELATQVAMAQKLASSTRAPDPALNIQLDRVPPPVVVLIQETLEAIVSCKLAEDAEALAVILKEVPKMTELTEAQRKTIFKLVKEAQASMPKDAKDKDNIAEVLNKLSAENRAPHHPKHHPSHKTPSTGKTTGKSKSPHHHAHAPHRHMHHQSHWHRHWSARHRCYTFYDPTYSCWYIWVQASNCYQMLDEGDE